VISNYQESIEGGHCQTSELSGLARCHSSRRRKGTASSRVANKNKQAWSVLTALFAYSLDLDRSQSLTFVVRLSRILFLATHPPTDVYIILLFL